ncbi:DUF2057 family protein [Vibrio sp. SCSIO 43135]|uniref:UPF0319 protein MD483_10355 n=1 Tax=Vibrio paucivorans TaxID=2829489 RepID=A0A9X3HRU9_9VIBR|nr:MULTISPECIES: DUF2057 family protein [Vibrio]MCW8334224.1 DUF2057 family protein [Vibrio paucivorans]USD43458.1 DUF2057 family protein [Vibrio sp. SCSIO 43135]
MNIIKPLSLALAITASGFAAADVTIQVPNNVDLLVVNGEKPEISGGFFSSEKTVTLPDGENQIVFRYTPYFDRSDERVTVESDAIITKFNTADKELSFSLPKYRNEREAKKDIDQFQWNLVDANGQSIETADDKLLKEGMQIGRDFRRETEDYNKTQGVAAVGVAAVAVQPVTLPAKIDQNAQTAVKGDSTAEEMLHFWYSKADADTKARFKQYVNAQ